MAKRQKIGKSEVLSAAAEVVQRGGEGALSVRAIAAALGSSTQPVYSRFKSIGEVRIALYEEAKRRYHAAIEAYLSAAGLSRYEAYGRGFVKFSIEEKGLFRFLFLGENRASVPFEDPFFEEITAEMMSLYHMDEACARAFHGDMGVFSYGLAVLAQTRDTPLDDEEIGDALKREFYALYAYYFPERPHFWEATQSKETL